MPLQTKLLWLCYVVKVKATLISSLIKLWGGKWQLGQVIDTPHEELSCLLRFSSNGTTQKERRGREKLFILGQQILRSASGFILYYYLLLIPSWQLRNWYQKSQARVMHRSVRPMYTVCFFAPWYFRKQKVMTQCWFNAARWTDTALQLVCLMLVMVANQLHIEKCIQLTFTVGDISLKLCNLNWYSTISVWFLPHLPSKSNKHIV